MRSFLFAFLLVALTARCGGPEASDAAPVSMPIAAQDTTEELLSDGGAVAMPRVKQRVLVREDSLWQRALALHYDAIVIDGHVDTPTLMLEEGYALRERHPAHVAHVDLPRMYEAGLDGAFLSIYIPPYLGEGPGALERAHALLDEIYEQVERSSDSIRVARTAADVRRIALQGRKAALLGLEGGHGLRGSTDALSELYGRGIRYVTLTHINTNSWADASQSPARWGGLNEKGVEMIAAMNRIGMMVDLSHTSDSTFYDALAATRAPVILSHSSARALTPNVRNVSDDMLRAVAENDGIVMVNFFDAAVNPRLDEELMADVRSRLSGDHLAYLWNVVYEVKRERGISGAHRSNVVDHIEHIARTAGVDHVGLGSDFDGVFDLPAGLEDVTRLPWITYELLDRGFTAEEVRKILGGNLLRVMEAVEAVAADLADQQHEKSSAARATEP